MEWKPMDTAPRNGEEILVAFGTGYESPPLLVMQWHSVARVWVIAGTVIATDDTPTHWRPLPEPPSEVTQ